MIDVDLFAGPGGLDEGRRLAGHDTVPLLALEWEAWACRTAAAAGHSRVRADVATFPTAHLTDRVRLLLGAPPCPTFSMAGKGAGRAALNLFVTAVGRMLGGDDVRAQVRTEHQAMLEAAAQLIEDPTKRNKALAKAPHEARDAALVLEPARWIHDTNPEAVVLEQVPAVLPIWQALARELRARGWSAWAGVLCAADYGVPQTRLRAIFIASRVQAVHPPTATHDDHPAEDLFGERLEPWVSMAEALGWLGEGTERPARTLAGHRAPRWLYPDPDGSHGRIVMRSNYSNDGDASGRTLRELDEPSVTLTSKPPQWELRVGTLERATRRPVDAPASTLFFGHQKNDVSWVVRTGNNTQDGEGLSRYERSIDEPAPTVDTGAGRKWTVGRPATTVQGDPRIAPPGHHDRQMADAIRITVTEAAVLQSFRPDYPWQGGQTRQFEQVGNAVPPLLGAPCITAALGLRVPEQRSA